MKKIIAGSSLAVASLLSPLEVAHAQEYSPEITTAGQTTTTVTNEDHTAEQIDFGWLPIAVLGASALATTGVGLALTPKPQQKH